ncbi:MAG TPA: response regulator [Chloroflexi bacterium]|nr:response regulator [Chloroflexota bacterium]
MPNQVTTLLLLEPDRATRQLYARELGKHWRVVAAEGAVEALDALAVEAIDVIILEPGAVDAEHWQVLTQVGEQLGEAAPPIIVCSSVDERGKGYELGASAYLVKPVSPQQLTMEVERWLKVQFRSEELE